MRETKVFKMFGVEYRCKQFSAAKAITMIEKIGMAAPMDMLAGTEVKIKRSWAPLSDPDNVNKYVVDVLDHLPRLSVLTALVNLVSDYNYGFLEDWKGARVPSRFMSDHKAVASEEVEPLVSLLIQEDKATLKDLEEYYCLEDAFKMFEVVVVKGINAAYAHEAAAAEAKRK